MSTARIESVAELHGYLQLGIEVELSTIPLYLYAYYSIADPATDAAKLVRSVATEEMLHATLLANVLLGTGGAPRFYDPDIVPTYPGPWPHRTPELILRLRRCTRDHVTSTFLQVERPIDGPVGDDVDAGAFDSQGHFYHSIEGALRRLERGDDGTGDLFADPQLDRQLTDPDGYHTVKFDSPATGGLIGVCDLATALAAVEVPIHQGEGAGAHDFADPGRLELTHFAKFQRLANGSTPIGEVRQAVDDPRLADMPFDVRAVAEFANAMYGYTLILMDRLFAGHRHGRRATLAAMYGVMEGLLGPACRYLMTLPAGGGRVWGPPFEFHEFADPAHPEPELRSRADALADRHPPLRPFLRHARRL